MVLLVTMLRCFLAYNTLSSIHSTKKDLVGTSYELGTVLDSDNREQIERKKKKGTVIAVRNLVI